MRQWLAGDVATRIDALAEELRMSLQQLRVELEAHVQRADQVDDRLARLERDVARVALDATDAGRRVGDVDERLSRLEQWADDDGRRAGAIEKRLDEEPVRLSE